MSIIFQKDSYLLWFWNWFVNAPTSPDSKTHNTFDAHQKVDGSSICWLLNYTYPTLRKFKATFCLPFLPHDQSQSGKNIEQFSRYLRKLWFYRPFIKKNKNIRRFLFLSAKFFEFSNSEYFRICLKNSSVGTKNNQEIILSSFRDISKKGVFFDLKMGDPCPIHYPPFTI